MIISVRPFQFWISKKFMLRILDNFVNIPLWNARKCMHNTDVDLPCRNYFLTEFTIIHVANGFPDFELPLCLLLLFVYEFRTIGNSPLSKRRIPIFPRLKSPQTVNSSHLLVYGRIGSDHPLILLQNNLNNEK